jgi:hypothetical protein
VDDTSAGTVTSFTFENVDANHTIDATFEPDVSASIGQVVAPEGNSGTTDFVFPVTLSGTCTETVDVTWKTVDGTATASGGDYVPDSTVVSFAPGETAQTVTVQVNGDVTPEDTETFYVQLENPVGAGIATAQGMGTILNDDAVTAAEGTAPRTFSFAIQGGNPVSDAVVFRLGLPVPARAELSVFDVQGRRIAEPVRRVLGAGYQTVRWSAREAGVAAGSGVYFVRFTAGGRTFTQRFVLLR